MGESDINKNRNGLIFYFISLHVPWGRGCLNYSGAVYLPGINSPFHLCLIFPLLSHLRHFSCDGSFHLGLLKEMT